jgi:exonuclease SbcC
MKILQLKYKNINSLYGENEIDFTHADFKNKIFAITGVTGAGKSSILDAITLALYAQTSRLNKRVLALISSSRTDAFSEVTFELNGKQYRSRFEQKKDEKSYLSEMYLYASNALLCKGVDNVTTTIERLIGLNFLQFTQSMVLSQGLFDRFLKSEPRERLQLLERVVSTEVYAEISKKVFQRASDERKSFERMEASLKNLVYLEPEKRKKLEERVALLEKEKSSYNIDKLMHTYSEKVAFDKLTEQSKAYKIELERLQKILIGRQTEEKQYKNFMQFSVAEKKKIEEAKLIDHELLFSNKNFLNLKSEIERTEKELQFIEQNIKKNDEELATFNVRKTLLKKELESFSNMTHLQQNHTLIASKFNERNRHQVELKKLQSMAYEELDDKELAEKVEVLEKSFSKLDREIKSQNIEKIEQQNFILENKISKLIEKERIEKSQISLNKLKEELELRVESIATQNSKVKKEKDDIAEMIRELEEKILLEKRIIDYEKDRAELKDNLPCPLCGSKEHPLFSEKIEPNRTEAMLEEKRADHEKSLAVYMENEKKIVELETQIKQIDEKLLEEKRRLMTLRDIRGDLHLLKEEHKTIQKEINSFKHQSDELDILKSKLSSSREALSKLRVEIQKNKNRKELEATLETKIKELNYYLIKTLRNYNVELDSNSMMMLDAKRKQYETLNKELKDLMQKMRPIEGQKMQNISRKTYIEESLQSLKKRASIQECDMLLMKQNRLALMGEKSTESYSLELDKKLKEQHDRYEDFKNLKNKFEEQKSLYFSSMEELEKKQKLKLLSFDTLEKEKNSVVEKLSVINQELGLLKSQIEQDKENIKKREDEKNSLEEQEKIAKEWNRLNELIGSENGEKYQIYVQGQTLSKLIIEANRYLDQLNNRYLLAIKDMQTLELEVIDLEQNRSKRGVNTLSGGESFIVSLSLSLGLLELNSEQVALNTLFLDEGFETLDEASLKLVIDRLSTLKSEGKIIGIISHIPLLKEQIKTQIRVEKRANGESELLVVGA